MGHILPELKSVWAEISFAPKIFEKMTRNPILTNVVCYHNSDRGSRRKVCGW
jgi:hypothetical protein